MAAYRVLSLDELEILKTDFIQFLAVQGISGEEWARWQKQSENRCLEYIDKFSEYVFVQVLEKVSLFERSIDKGAQFIQVTGDTMKFVSIQTGEDSVDWSKIGLENCEVVKGKKAIQKTVHDEKFSLLQQGFAPVVKDRIDAVLSVFETIEDL